MKKAKISSFLKIIFSTFLAVGFFFVNPQFTAKTKPGESYSLIKVSQALVSNPVVCEVGKGIFNSQVKAINRLMNWGLTDHLDGLCDSVTGLADLLESEACDGDFSIPAACQPAGPCAGLEFDVTDLPPSDPEITLCDAGTGFGATCIPNNPADFTLEKNDTLCDNLSQGCTCVSENECGLFAFTGDACEIGGIQGTCTDPSLPPSTQCLKLDPPRFDCECVPNP